jgi:tripartite-type tricarboxylate transporter receptor subunit TctC
MKRFLAAAVAALIVTPAASQDWPPRTTTMVLGLGPGSGLDLFARVIVDALQEKLGTTFVIDYRVGAAGNIAVAHLARAPADGSVIGGRSRQLAEMSVDVINPSGVPPFMVSISAAANASASSVRRG